MRRSMQSERAEAARRRGTVAKSVLAGALLGYALASGGGFVNGAVFAVLFGACFGLVTRWVVS